MATANRLLFRLYRIELRPNADTVDTGYSQSWLMVQRQEDLAKSRSSPGNYERHARKHPTSPRRYVRKTLIGWVVELHAICIERE